MQLQLFPDGTLQNPVVAARARALAVRNWLCNLGGGGQGGEMSYRFKAGDVSIADGVRRIADAEFSQIREALADTSLPLARKVHECRKSTKRLRSLLRLVAPVLPGARNEISELREAAGQLSALRDWGALQEAIALAGFPEDLAARLSEALAKRRAPGAAAQKTMLAAFAAEMDDASARAQSWELERDGWRALAPGLVRSHHRFRKSVRAARRAKHEDPVHFFRKRAKDHWYQTLLLRGAFPGVMDGYALAGERLCDDLGDWRDLGLLEAAVQGLPERRLSKADAEAALGLVAKARRRALRRGFRAARRLAAETPDAYCARLEIWWKSGR